jgi:hypothetical protein
MAFQRKRSGDWLQALSSADSNRLYTLPSGERKRLTCPLYFCTEDRVAVAYSIALGLNTIYYNSNTQILILYTNSLYKHTKGDFFTCKPMAFLEEKIPKYKALLQKAFDVYNTQTTFLREQLQTRELNTNDNILSYITLLYEYSLLEDMMFPFPICQASIDKFQSNPFDLSELEKYDITSLYYRAKSRIPQIESFDLKDQFRFPYMKKVLPISTSLALEPSDIYISTLLKGIMRDNVHMINGMEKCIRRIIELSIPSEHRSFHYATILRDLDSYRVSGGRQLELLDPILHTPNRSIRSLGVFYLAYLSLHTSTPLPKSDIFPCILNYFQLGGKSITMVNSGLNLVYNCMKRIVQEYGILEKEFETMIEAIRNSD